LPKFSIILPVKNGGEYVKLCIASILNQRYSDFELLVLDNCSTDGTTEWVRSIKDPRVKLFPSNNSLSIEENWNRVLSIPKSEFMTLIGHDDLLANDYLETMNEMVRSNPNASLFQTHFDYIDANGKLIRHCKPMKETEEAITLLEDFLQNKIDVMGTGFLMRSADYNSLGGIPPYPNLLFADFELWIKLTKLSFLAVSPKTCFSFRLHQSMTTRSADEKFIRAYERFILFLESLARSNDQYKEVIRSFGSRFLLFYCKGLSHRLLRTRGSERKGFTVKKMISKTKEFSERLGIPDLAPLSVPSIKLAYWIDSFSLTRIAFLGFKAIFKRPVLK
jgi:glycosyltransferase involved in cell wall biosynthesis